MVAPLAASIFVAFAITRTSMFKSFAIENNVNGKKHNGKNQKQAEKVSSCVYQVPVNLLLFSKLSNLEFNHDDWKHY